MIRRTKFILVVLCFITVFILISVGRSQKGNVAVADAVKIHGPEKLIIFHLDLKGAPPKISFLLELLPLARRAGANALLVEYEDSFPWTGSLKNISAGNAYTNHDLNKLLKLASDLRMNVIPLVQTFGHLEFVLKLQEFRHLRELDTFPQEVCPAKSESFQMIKEMIRQIMAVHKDTQYLHIGCDEVYHLAACSVCSKLNQRDVFSKHVKRVAEFVRDSYPGVTPLIWDDMLRHWSPIDIEESGLGEFVEPMVWVYIDDIPRLVPHFLWFVYKKTFKNLWAASAFKGAFGEKQTLPDISRHSGNSLAWMRLIFPKETENSITRGEDFAGIALTGWSRYDHFAVLSELLPVAVPSLIVNLALTNAYFHGNDEKNALRLASEILNCPNDLPFHSVQEMQPEQAPWVFKNCAFPGRPLYELILNFQLLQTRFRLVIQQLENNGWVAQYNIKRRYTSPHRVLQLFPEEGFAAQNLLKNVKMFRTDVLEDLGKFYDKSVVAEWIEDKIDPILRKLTEIGDIFQVLIERKTWPRRPLQ